ncbi:alpha/beta hydrolase [Halobacillus fulvus]|nr:alpha/beta hydrolase [Halobacillus fulvus]
MKDILTNKRRLLTILMSSLLLGLAVFLSQSKPTRSEPMTSITPTVFVHGYKGGPRSFDTMINRFEQNGWGTSQMTITVTKQGFLRIKGNLRADSQPLVQIIFQNNRASLDDQTLWLQSIMRKLHEEYGISEVNLVGHSMGGLATTSYMLNNQHGEYPAVRKMALIASPFDGIHKPDYFEWNTGEAAKDLHPDSEALRELVKRKEFFNQQVEVLAIAGVVNESEQEDFQWDGLVHLKSVRAIQNIVPDAEMKVVREGPRTHSGLHENEKVDQYVHEFLK